MLFLNWRNIAHSHLTTLTYLASRSTHTINETNGYRHKHICSSQPAFCFSGHAFSPNHNARSSSGRRQQTALAVPTLCAKPTTPVDPRNSPHWWQRGYSRLEPHDRRWRLQSKDYDYCQYSRRTDPSRSSVVAVRLQWLGRLSHSISGLLTRATSAKKLAPERPKLTALTQLV